MKLSDFHLLKEDDDSYTVGHPEGKSMKFPKKGLSSKAKEQIGKLKQQPEPETPMAEGGEANSSSQPAAPYGASDVDVDPYSAPNPDIPTDAEIAQAPAQPIPAQDTTPSADQTTPQTPSSQPQGGALPGSFSNAPIQQAEKTIQAGAAAETKAGQTEADVYKNLADQSQQIQNDAQVRQQSYQNQSNAFQTQLQNQKIDPNRYWNNLSTGSKIASSLAMLVSGLSGRSDNMAMGVLHNAINNDIQSQMNDQSKTMNLWKMNREALGDDKQATLATQNQLLNVAKYKAMQAQAGASGAQAQARIAPAILSLDQQIQQNNRMRSMLDMANTPAQSSPATNPELSGHPQGSGSNLDPAQLVSTMVPPAHQQKVFDEIEAAQNTKRMGGAILKAFDQAAQDNTVLKTGAGLVRTPASVYAFHQAMQPTFKDIEGTVRQAAMDNTFRNTTPSPGDFPSSTATKREALENYIRSKASAATAKGYNIDLSKFNSTSPGITGRQPGTIVSVKGRQFKVGADGNTLTPL